jgi:hypothetical protein
LYKTAEVHWDALCINQASGITTLTYRLQWDFVLESRRRRKRAQRMFSVPGPRRYDLPGDTPEGAQE